MTDSKRFPEQPIELQPWQEVHHDIHHGFVRSFAHERLIPLRELARLWLRGDNLVLRRYRPERGLTYQHVAGGVLLGLLVGFVLGLYFAPWLFPVAFRPQLVAEHRPAVGSVLWLSEGE